MGAPYIIEINGKDSGFSINEDKLQTIYFISGKNTAMLELLERRISQDVSGFNFMPDDDLFDMDYLDRIFGPNSIDFSKIKDIEDLKLNKFEVSKLISKQILISNITGNASTRFMDESLKIFDEKSILENYVLWESMFTYYIINERYDYFQQFIEQIVKAIELAHSKETLDGNNVFATLLLHLTFSISRAASLVLGRYSNDLFEKISKISFDTKKYSFSSEYTKEKIEEYQNHFFKSSLFDKRYVPLLFIHGINVNEKSIRLTNINDLISLYQSESKFDTDYMYYPFVIQFFDLKMLSTISKMVDGKAVTSSAKSWRKLLETYYQINFNNSDCNIIGNSVEYRNETLIAKYKKQKITIAKINTSKLKKMKIAIANTNTSKDWLCKIMRDEPDRSIDRYKQLKKIVNQAIVDGADLLLLPEAYVPLGWLGVLNKKAMENDMAIIAGVEHIKIKNSREGPAKVYNLTAVILPFKKDTYSYTNLDFHSKVHMSPNEKEEIEGYGGAPVEGKRYNMFVWKDVWFAPYCCYEFTSIRDRSIFQSYADLIVVVECNRDVNYFSSIIESLSRDIHCYCAQVNSSRYGDSRITQPTETERRDIMKVKGGVNDTVIIDSIDIKGLRDFQLKGHNLQAKDRRFKLTPPNFDREIVKQKKNGWFFDKNDQ